MYGRLIQFGKKMGRHCLVAVGLAAFWPAVPAHAQSLGSPIPLSDIQLPVVDADAFLKKAPDVTPVPQASRMASPKFALPPANATGITPASATLASPPISPAAISTPSGMPAYSGIQQAHIPTPGGIVQSHHIDDGKKNQILQALASGVDKKGGIQQTSCTSCNRGLLSNFGHMDHGAGGCASCGTGHCPPNVAHCNTGPGQCVPGHTNCCSWCKSDSIHGKMLCGFYHCLCCPDPCYEPKWVAAANASFFVDGARPVTQTRIRWDSGYNFKYPDRAEWFWARSDGNGRGPGLVETGLHYNEFMLYTEVAATPGFSIFTNIPYRSVAPDINPHGAGFSDMTVGTKSVLFDCELVQLTFQFATILPVGNAGKGVGTGHVSLDPSLLLALKLTPDTYFQGQFGEWIPLGGDSAYAGATMHWHGSLNHVLYRCLPDVPLIGTWEWNGYSFQDGQYTNLNGIPTQASNKVFLNMGGGLRLVVCDRIDIGAGAVWALNDPGYGTLYRTEFRVRY